MVELQNKGLKMYDSNWSSIIELQDGQVVSDALDSAFGNIDTALLDIDTKLNGAGYSHIILTPQAVEPAALSEGMMYYDLVTHTFVAINDIDGTRLNLGYELNERCSNHTGATITDGKVVAVSGTDVDDNFEMILADSTLLNTAVAFGVTTSSSADGEVALVTTKGRVNGVDTVGIGENEPIYLGTLGNLVGIAPEITTVVGHVVKAQSGVGIADGVIYVAPRSIISLPNVVAFMNQNTPTASITLSTTPVPVDNYDVNDSAGIIMGFVPLTGIITAPSNGIYDMTIDFGVDYTETTDNATHLLMQIMANNGVDAPYEVGRYNKEVAKRSVTTNGSMTKTFTGEKNVQYYLQMSAPDEDFTAFVLENVSFSLKSIDIR